MNADLGNKVQQAYRAALLLPSDQRAAFLAQSCAGDPQLLREVESLLAHPGNADGLLGQTISHYRITAKLGEGGMGVVWKALDTELNRPVALKTLLPGSTADESRHARFLHEARSASALNHPNIVTIHDILRHDGATYLVMEFVDGKSLDQLIPKKGLRLNDALRYAIQIAGALNAAHKIGIVHRDLKPANVMVTPAGVVKVLDFGLAKPAAPAVPSADDPTRSVRALTEEGIIVGSLNYMSPEQAGGKPVDTRSDIFSFGAVLYEMISGSRAFQGDSRISTLSAVIKEEPKPLHGVPSDLAKLLKRCLRKDPERRAQHIIDVKLALEDIQEELDSGQFHSATPARPARKWIGLAVAAFLAVSGAAAVYLSQRPVTTETPVTRPVPITSFAGDETGPTLSPDGNQVAFSWNGENRDNADIYVKLVSGGPPLRLTTHPARDYAAAWSPDGTQLAFLRSDQSGSGQESVMLISPLGGPERQLTRISSNIIDTGIAWSADSKSIAVADRASPAEAAFSVATVGLTSGERRWLTKAPPGSHGDLRMSFSPDGKYLAFARHPNSSIADLYVLELRSGAEPRRLDSSTVQIENITWTPSSNEIVYSSNGVLWRRSVVNPAGRPVAITGIDASAIDPVLSPSGRLVFARLNVDANIWRLNAGEPGTKPAQIVASTYADDFPHLSPDSSRLVFSSSRSGNYEIWVSDSDGANPVRLTFLDATSHSPRWSPDGRRIAFSSLARDGNRDLYVIDPSGGSLRRMTTGPIGEGRPNWSRDGQWLYFYARAEDSTEIWKMPAEGGKAVQVTTNGGHSGEESPDGKDLYYSKLHELTHGIFHRSLAGGEETRVIERTYPGWWAACDQGIYFVEISGRRELENPPLPIRFWDYRTRKVTNVAVIEKSIRPPSIGFSASRDCKVITWVQNDHRNSDLVLIDNFR